MSSSFEKFCKLISGAKCDTCHRTLIPLDSDNENDEPPIYRCEECDMIYGVDDACSEDECVRYIEKLDAGLKDGNLRAKACSGCGNNNINRFIFVSDGERDQVALECMCCHHVGLLNGENDPADVASLADSQSVYRGGNEKSKPLTGPQNFNTELPLSPQNGNRQPISVHHQDVDFLKHSMMQKIYKTSRSTINQATAFSDAAHSGLKGVLDVDKETYLNIGLIGTEIINVCFDVEASHRKMRAGELSGDEYSQLCVESVASGVGGAAGALLLRENRVLGHTLGAVIGKGISCLAGRYLGDK